MLRTNMSIPHGTLPTPQTKKDAKSKISINLIKTGFSLELFVQLVLLIQELLSFVIKWPNILGLFTTTTFLHSKIHRVVNSTWIFLQIVQMLGFKILLATLSVCGTPQFLAYHNLFWQFLATHSSDKIWLPHGLFQEHQQASRNILIEEMKNEFPVNL
jgi:hypothetical protein